MTRPTDYRMSTWTIFRRPADHPGTEYVVREFYLLGGGRDPVPSDEVWLCSSLEQARASVPLEAACIPRAPEDDPTIVESWL
jgi:hypothetical protein